MKWHQVMMGLALMAGGDLAWSIRDPLVDAPHDTSEWRARAAAGAALSSLSGTTEPKVRVACDRCKSGYAIKVVEQVLQKQPAVSADQLAEVERLRVEAQALYDQKKYVESLEVSRKAQAILGVDTGGGPLARSAGAPPGGARAESPADR